METLANVPNETTSANVPNETAMNSEGLSDTVMDSSSLRRLMSGLMGSPTRTTMLVENTTKTEPLADNFMADISNPTAIKASNGKRQIVDQSTGLASLSMNGVSDELDSTRAHAISLNAFQEYPDDHNQLHAKPDISVSNYHEEEEGKGDGDYDSL